MHIDNQKQIVILLSYFLTFCVSLDSAVFIPNILEYLNEFEIPQKFILGLTIAGYSLTSSLSLKFLKYLVNAANYNVRWLVLVCHGCYIVGGLMYSLAGSPWAIIIARWLCGIGSGVWAVINAEISSSSLDHEFDQLLERLKLFLMFGWLIAPIISLIFTSSEIYTTEIANHAICGLIMSTLFITSSLFTIIGWFDLGKTLRYCRLRDTISLAYERISIGSRKSYGSTSPGDDVIKSQEYAYVHGLDTFFSIKPEELSPDREDEFDNKQIPTITKPLKKSDTVLTISDEVLEEAEMFMGNLQNFPTNMSSPDVTETPGDGFISEADYTLSRIRLLRDKAWCKFPLAKWLSPQFVIAFLFGVIQTILTPLTESFFQFGGIENAVMQSILGVLGVSIKVAISYFQLPPKVNAFFGYLLAAVSFGWLIMLCPAFESGLGNLPSFCAGMLGVSLACGVICSGCSHDDQENCENSSVWIDWTAGLVIGPLWAGTTFHHTRVMLGGNLVVVIFAAICTLLV